MRNLIPGGKNRKYFLNCRKLLKGTSEILRYIMNNSEKIRINIRAILNNLSPILVPSGGFVVVLVLRSL